MSDETRLDGMLRGMRREVKCTVLVWKEASSTGRLYTRGKITDAPADLPDGSYTLSFGEHTFVTRKWEGHWLLKYLPSELEISEAA